jgi:hypothetical protein
MTTIVIRTKELEVIVSNLKLLLDPDASTVWSKALAHLQKPDRQEGYEHVHRMFLTHRKHAGIDVHIIPTPLPVGCKYALDIKRDEDQMLLSWNGMWHLEIRGTGVFRAEVLRRIVKIDPLALDGMYDNIGYFTLEELLERTSPSLKKHG